MDGVAVAGTDGDGSAGPSVLVIGNAADRATVAPLAAAAGVALVMDPGPPRDMPAWRSAAVVVVGASVAEAPAPPRRTGVVVLARPGGDDAGPAGPLGPGTDAGDASRHWRVAVGVGAEEVLVLPAGRGRLLDRLTLAAEAGRPGRVVGVVGGCGGAGASVLAAALAVVAERWWPPALLVDADPLGAGCDGLLGAGSPPGLRWPDLVAAGGPVRAAVLRDAVPRDPGTGTGLLGWQPGEPRDLPSAVLAGALAVAGRGHAVVVADLPRRLDPAVLARLDVLLVVVPPQLRAVASALATLAPLRHALGDARVVLGGVPARRAGAAGVPGLRVADELELPVVGSVPHRPRLAEALARGLPPGEPPRDPLARACSGLLAALLADVPDVASAAGARGREPVPQPGGTGGRQRPAAGPR
jgi:secretion/DNA translocation related CpaE-like protein